MSLVVPRGRGGDVIVYDDNWCMLGVMGTRGPALLVCQPDPGAVRWQVLWQGRLAWVLRRNVQVVEHT